MDPFAFEGVAEIIAHRGFSARAPENTLVALERAIAAGADALEFDLHLTADGVPILFHDGTLRRTTDGSGEVAHTAYQEIRTLDAGRWFAPEFEGERVPSLAETLVRVRDRVGRLYPEIKGVRGPAEVARIVEVVREAGALDRSVFISMDWEALGEVRALEARARIGYIVKDVDLVEEAIARAASDPLALLDFRARILLSDPPLADRIRREGIPMAVWTVDDPEDATRLLDMGVPRITTNEVERLLRWKASLRGP